MSKYYDQTRLIVAKRDDEFDPMVIAAMPQTTWEVVPPDEWDKWKRDAAERMFGGDWTAYDLIEVVMTFPNEKLAAMFEAREINPTSIELDMEDEA